MYKELVAQNYPDVKYIVNRHLVVTKDDFPMATAFEFSQASVEMVKDEMSEAIKGIANKDFKEKEVSWKTVNTLGKWTNETI